MTNPQFSEEVGEDRWNQLVKQNPECVVSACPACEYSLDLAQEHASQDTKNVEIKDFIELIADSLGLTY